MPYKRKARVLFFGSGEPCRALLAASMANEMGAEWIEARAVALPETNNIDCSAAGLDAADRAGQVLNQEISAWADLIITLDDAADAACPPLPSHVQKRCYPVAPADSPADWLRVREAIQQRVEGMIGGMRMINRSA